MKKIENDLIAYWIDDGILYSEFKKPIVMTLENIKSFISLRHEISNNQKQYWCSDITSMKSFTKEGRDYADIHGQDFLYASAVIVNSHITMFIFNVFLKIKNVKIPFKAFKNKEDAVIWLKKLQSSPLNKNTVENKHEGIRK
jgi:hypothetical protein